MFTIIPAIDLKDGRCVRLRQGRASDVTVYSDHPADMARQWMDQAATYLHVVDLDGAFVGRPVHDREIASIAEAVDIPVEVGGGLRTDAHVRQVLACGVRRAILGTRALTDSGAMRSLVDEFGDRIAVGIDARDGNVQIRGWVETTGARACELGAEVCEAGVAMIVYTDTAQDGMLRGPNLAAIDEMCRSVSCSVIASGGIHSAEDITALRGLGLPNLSGAIVGKALYEGRVTLDELHVAAA